MEAIFEIIITLISEFLFDKEKFKNHNALKYVTRIVYIFIIILLAIFAIGLFINKSYIAGIIIAVIILLLLFFLTLFAKFMKK